MRDLFHFISGFAIRNQFYAPDYSQSYDAEQQQKSGDRVWSGHRFLVTHNIRDFAAFSLQQLLDIKICMNSLAIYNFVERNKLAAISFGTEKLN